MNQITCLLADDEPFARKGLENYIKRVDFLELKGQFEDAIDLGKVLAEIRIDLLFLDIQMPHLTGVEFIKSLKDPPKVIFTTAFKEYAIDGYDLDVLDYLLKPISWERFLKAALKAKDYFDQRVTERYPAFIFVKSEGKLEKIVFDEILYIEAMENYIFVYTSFERLLIKSTMKLFLEKLSPQNFLQVHKSFIVALDKIKAFEGNKLFIGIQEIPISRSLREMVLSRINKGN